MLRNQGIRKAVIASVVALGLSSTAFAQTASTASGLGQSWPNASDVSANPNWHVYVFVLNGVEYVQVNDLNGTVHAAIGTAGGSTIVLPVGVDSQNVTTSTQAATSSNTVTIYSDSSTTVTATPQSNGTTQFNAANNACSLLHCTGGSGG